MVMTHKIKGKILAQMGRTICSRVSLLKKSISPHNFKRWYTHDVNQRQILEEILSFI